MFHASLAAMLVAVGAAPDATVTTADAARHLRASPSACAAADTNGDGRIDDAELSAVRRTLAKAKTEAPAANTAKTSRGSLLPHVGSHDYNGDGALTPAELYVEAR